MRCFSLLSQISRHVAINDKEQATHTTVVYNIYLCFDNLMPAEPDVK